MIKAMALSVFCAFALVAYNKGVSEYVVAVGACGTGAVPACRALVCKDVKCMTHVKHVRPVKEDSNAPKLIFPRDIGRHCFHQCCGSVSNTVWGMNRYLSIGVGRNWNLRIGNEFVRDAALRDGALRLDIFLIGERDLTSTLHPERRAVARVSYYDFYARKAICHAVDRDRSRAGIGPRLSLANAGGLNNSSAGGGSGNLGFAHHVFGVISGPTGMV